MQSGYNLSDLVQEAQSRWLKPSEVFFILLNYEDHQLTDKPPQKPAGGSLFLFNKRVLRFFRKDGHSWRKKKDGRTVGEAHERLKVGNAEALNCYYAHGDLNLNFQRRSYWMLDPAYEHIVLVHYRDITEVLLVIFLPSTKSLNPFWYSGGTLEDGHIVNVKGIDLTTKKTIGKGRATGGLYLFDESSFGVPKLVVCSAVASPLQVYCQLGNPSLSNLKKLMPNFHSLSSLECESCQFWKHHRVTYPSRVKKRSATFDLVHYDV